MAKWSNLVGFLPNPNGPDLGQASFNRVGLGFFKVKLAFDPPPLIQFFPINTLQLHRVGGGPMRCVFGFSNVKPVAARVGTIFSRVRVWVWPNLTQMSFFLYLGCGNNFIQACLVVLSFSLPLFKIPIGAAEKIDKYVLERSGI